MRTFVLLISLLAAGASAGEEGISKPAGRLVESALRTAKGSRLADRQKEKLLEEAQALSDEDLDAVVRRLRAETEPLKTLVEVRALLENVHVTRRWGEEAAKRIPDVLDLLEREAADVRKALLADSLRLEDLRLARDLLGRSAAAKIPSVRVRAALAAGSMLAWGEMGAEAARALAALLEDPDPGVRVAAIRAGFLAAYDPVFPWAVAHLDDAESGPVEFDGEEQGRSPGAEALERILEVTRLDIELAWPDFHRLRPEEKEPVRALFTGWWKEKGERFPPPGTRETEFRPAPSTTAAAVVGQGETSAAFQLWAGVDRTRIRVVVEELEAFATSPYDWRVHFHLRYMAQGMRADDGESFVRHLPVGSRHILARKAIGCYVLSFQPLFDGRLKIRLWFHDPAR